MKKRNAWMIVLLGALVSVPLALAEPAVPEPLRSAFYPYSVEPFRLGGIAPGMTIDQRNWQLAEQLLPPEILHLVQVGDFTISAQETTDLPARVSYITTTGEHFLGVSLDGGYKIEHYQGGRPFPVLDPADPRAGEKAAWNLRYRDVPDTMEMRGTMQGVNNAGTIDRSNVGRMRIRYGMYRVGDEENDPEWEAQSVRTLGAKSFSPLSFPLCSKLVEG